MESMVKKSQCEENITATKKKIKELEKHIESLDDLKRKLEKKEDTLVGIRKNLLRTVENAYECGASLDFMKSFRKQATEAISGDSFRKAINIGGMTKDNIVKERARCIRELSQLEHELQIYRNDLVECENLIKGTQNG